MGCEKQPIVGTRTSRKKTEQEIKTTGPELLDNAEAEMKDSAATANIC